MPLDCCAACGKADTALKACGSCRSVKYCNVDCQRAHRPAHKKSCKQKAAELFDEKLFAEPPPREDCPICFLTLSPHGDECTYMACCGKTICSGCRYSLNREHCPFCNTESPENDEAFNKNLFDRIEKFNDPGAMNALASYYTLGIFRFPVNHSKAAELYRRGSELGCPSANYNLGLSYNFGNGIDQDSKKAVHHWQVAAMMGHEMARHNLGIFEANYGTMDRAMRHFIIAAKRGHDDSLEEVKTGFREGLVAKHDMEKTLRDYQSSHDETKSGLRDRAKAINNLLQPRPQF